MKKMIFRVDHMWSIGKITALRINVKKKLHFIFHFIDIKFIHFHCTSYPLTFPFILEANETPWSSSYFFFYTQTNIALCAFEGTKFSSVLSLDAPFLAVFNGPMLYSIVPYFQRWTTRGHYSLTYLCLFVCRSSSKFNGNGTLLSVSRNPKDIY